MTKYHQIKTGQKATLQHGQNFEGKKTGKFKISPLCVCLLGIACAFWESKWVNAFCNEYVWWNRI